MVLARPGTDQASGGRPEPGHRSWQLPAAAACALSLAACVAVASGHHLVTWFDLAVYNHAGHLARSAPQQLYSWQLRPGIRFTYPPFAALVFAVTSLLPWTVLKWLMIVASLAALAGSIWLTLGALGRTGRGRVTATLGLTAVALWTEPVQHGLGLGQIELLLMALIVWDLCQPDRRWWKGAGIGLAAGIKLAPLIFIPYLVLSGKLRQAAVAAAAFAGTVVAGFAFLPGASGRWWWTGYFLQAGKAGDAASLVNQSLFALVARAEESVRNSTPTWLAAAAVVAAVGLTAAAVLHRSGQPVAGWVTCALTGLLVSPISWDHHWVWIVLVLVVLADAAQRARGAARRVQAAGAGVAVVFGDWPSQWTGPLAFVPRGLLGFFPGPFGRNEKYHLHGLQVIGWNLYVIAGLVMLAAAVAAAACAAGRGRRAGLSCVPVAAPTGRRGRLDGYTAPVAGKDNGRRWYAQSLVWPHPKACARRAGAAAPSQPALGGGSTGHH
jgi:alpha-1,2-mannosyltransferase